VYDCKGSRRIWHLRWSSVIRACMELVSNVLDWHSPKEHDFVRRFTRFAHSCFCWWLILQRVQCPDRLPHASEYTFSLLSNVVENLERFKGNTDVRSLNTRRKCDVHIPDANQISGRNILHRYQVIQESSTYN
jgi:hypothetical protein